MVGLLLGYCSNVRSGDQIAERLRNRAQKVAGSILAVPNEVVSLGKALEPYLPRGMSLYLL